MYMYDAYQRPTQLMRGTFCMDQIKEFWARTPCAACPSSGWRAATARLRRFAVHHLRDHRRPRRPAHDRERERRRRRPPPALRWRVQPRRRRRRRRRRRSGRPRELHWVTSRPSPPPTHARSSWLPRQRRRPQQDCRACCTVTLPSKPSPRCLRLLAQSQACSKRRRAPARLPRRECGCLVPLPPVVSPDHSRSWIRRRSARRSRLVSRS